MVEPPQEADTPWKEALGRYFEPFTAFFFPAAHREIDWARGSRVLRHRASAGGAGRRARAAPGRQARQDLAKGRRRPLAARPYRGPSEGRARLRGAHVR